VDLDQRLGEAGAEHDLGWCRKRSVLLDALAERRRVQELGCQPGLLGRDVEVQQPGGVPAANPETGRQLALESRPEVGVVGQFGPHHLDR
jgi:hypothetical protein